MYDVESKTILNRIKLALNAITFEQVAQILEVSPATINTWRQRNKIPEIYLMKVSNLTNMPINVFTDLDDKISSAYSQKITNQNGNNSLINNGIQNNTKNPFEDVDTTTQGLILEAYKKAQKEDKLKDFRIHLMNF